MTSQNDSNKLTLANLDENLKKELIDELFKKMEEEKETKRRNKYYPDENIPFWFPFVLLFICCIPYAVIAIAVIYFYFTNTDETVEKFRNELDTFVGLIRTIKGKVGNSLD